MLVGYMRVSTDTDQRVLELQRDALIAAGVDKAPHVRRPGQREPQ
jgi:DNA invertase Pin-like site-specific DNA recombinase